MAVTVKFERQHEFHTEVLARKADGQWRYWVRNDAFDERGNTPARKACDVSEAHAIGLLLIWGEHKAAESLYPSDTYMWWGEDDEYRTDYIIRTPGGWSKCTANGGHKGAFSAHGNTPESYPLPIEESAARATLSMWHVE